MSMLARKIRSRAIKALTARVSPDRVKAALRAVGYDPGHWVRTVMYRECFRMIQELSPEGLDVRRLGVVSKEVVQAD